VQADALGDVAIEEVGANGFADVGAQVIPVVALRKDAEGQALGTIAAVGFLGDLEDQFGHGFICAFAGLGTGQKRDRHAIRKGGEIRGCPFLRVPQQIF